MSGRQIEDLGSYLLRDTLLLTKLIKICVIYIKVRLWWLGAVLQNPRKCEVFLSSLSIPIMSISN